VNSLGDVLRLGNALDELGDELLDILVDDELAHLLHRLVGVILDLLLSVPHGFGDDGDEIRDAESGLSWSGADNGIDEVQSGHLLGPLLGVAERLDNSRESGLNGVRVDGLCDGQSRSNSGILDGGDLVASASKNTGKKGDKIRLDMGRNLRVLSNCLNGKQRLLASSGILLVSQILLESLDSPMKSHVSNCVVSNHLGRCNRSAWRMA